MINEEDKEKINRFLDQVQSNDIDKYMNMCYHTVVNYPEQLINHTLSTKEQKISNLNIMIEHFIEKDEYEKCTELKKIVEIIEEND